jgi:hypothetical protein
MPNDTASTGIPTMNETCPHCSSVVALPRFAASYGNLPVECHACNECFFPFTHGTGAIAKTKCNSCKSTLYIPKSDTQRPEGRFLCPLCHADVAVKNTPKYQAGLAIIVALVIGLGLGAFLGWLRLDDIHDPDQFLARINAVLHSSANNVIVWVDRLITEFGQTRS